MPAGVSTPRYIAFFAASMLSMLAGSQVVHHYYRPLDDLEEMIKDALVKHREKEELSEPDLLKKTT